MTQHRRIRVRRPVSEEKPVVGVGSLVYIATDGEVGTYAIYRVMRICEETKDAVLSPIPSGESFRMALFLLRVAEPWYLAGYRHQLLSTLAVVEDCLTYGPDVHADEEKLNGLRCDLEMGMRPYGAGSDDVPELPSIDTADEPDEAYRDADIAEEYTPTRRFYTDRYGNKVSR